MKFEWHTDQFSSPAEQLIMFMYRDVKYTQIQLQSAQLNTSQFPLILLKLLAVNNQIQEGN